MRRTLTAALTAALLAGALSAATLAQSPAAGGTNGLDGTSWLLSAYVSGGALIPVAPGYIVDATFRDASVAGFSGCNEYVAPATVNGSMLAIGPIATTGRMCKMAIPIEQDYLAALASANSFNRAGDGLTIYDASGAPVLDYAPAPSDPLDGPWAVIGFNNGAGAIVSPADGTELTVNFGPDGQVFGSSGCNTYNGSFTYGDGSLVVGALAMTMMACDDALNAQEQQLLTALQVPTTVEASGGTITLRDANGAMQVTLARP